MERRQLFGDSATGPNDVTAGADDPTGRDGLSAMSDHIMKTSRIVENIAAGPRQLLYIAATFTAEPIADALAYWMDKLKLPFDIGFAPYNQVFQQLLDPASSVSRNTQGINIVLIRLEDFYRFEKAAHVAPLARKEKLAGCANELVQAMRSATAHLATPIIVCLCPASPAIAMDGEQTALLQEIEERLNTEMEALSAVHLITSKELVSRYPVENYYDAYSDRAGHIPYTTAFFTAVATLLARTIVALRTPARKVIVLDCDNTLWKGVCAEDGPSNVEIDSSYRALQEVMVAQHAAGKLLCLCSKNSESDVFDVFAHHQEMPLKREHILAWRINWQPKSANVIALAKELQLGLDSFIFVDDSPLECAEVQARCPEVLTVQLPAQSEQIPRFLQSVWSFDYLKITGTDRQRTELYRQNMQRESLRQETSTLEDFLARLELEINISEMAPDQIERAAQLTLRTNQFNTTTIRRGAGEIRQLAQIQKLEFYVVEVRDRFGDYGLVGLMACEAEEDLLRADTFLLSCRVLGRRVEHHMLMEMGKIAIAKGLNGVTVPFQPTPTNQPALDFLNEAGADRRQSYGQVGWLFTFPVSAISTIGCDVGHLSATSVT